MWRTFAALALGLVLVACDVSGFVPQEHQDFAKRVVMMVQNRDDAGLQAVTHPDLWMKLPEAMRARMATMFPPGAPSDITISSWKSNWNNDVASVQMTMMYKYPQRDVQVDLAFQSGGGRQVLTMIYLKPVAAGSTPSPAPQQQNAPPQQDAPQQDQRQQDDKSTTL
jgi:hypothetical protein